MVTGGLKRKDNHDHCEKLFILIFEREERMLPPPWAQLNVTPSMARTLSWSMGWEDPTEGFWAWIILPVLHLRRLPIQGATSVKWTPIVQWWVLRKRLNYSHVAHTGESCNRGGLVRHLHWTKDLDACHTNSINHPHGQPEKQHSPQEMFKVKEGLLFPHLHSSSVLSLKESLQVSQGKKESFEPALKF